jgi:hypothetical protein
MDDDNEHQANAYMQDSTQGFGDIQGAPNSSGFHYYVTSTFHMKWANVF